MQVLKDEVGRSIEVAALRVFALKGYEASTMAMIAREAGISTGNIYRYFRNKEELFYVLLPATFVKELKNMFRRQVESLKGVKEISSLEKSDPYFKFARELLEHSLKHRLHLIILLRRSRGTKYENFPQEMVGQLKDLAIQHAQSLSPKFSIDAEKGYCLQLIYENFVKTLGEILVKYQRIDKIQTAIKEFQCYHLNGLKAFFGH